MWMNRAVAVAVGVALGACSPSGPGEGWTTYQDPSGLFSVDAPSGWQVSSDSQTGRIDVAGAGETVELLPLFTRVTLSPDAAASTLETIAVSLQPKGEWQSATIESDSTARMIGTVGDQDAVAILTYATSTAGTAGTVYLALDRKSTRLNSSHVAIS